MRCLVLIALSLALANAITPRQLNKIRFARLLHTYGNQLDDIDTQYQPGHRQQLLGGLHDYVGRGIYYPTNQFENDETCGPYNQQQCLSNQEFENGQQEFYDNEDLFGNQHQYYGQQDEEIYGQYPLDDEYNTLTGDEYEQEFQQGQYGPYGSPFQQQGQCSPNPRMLPKLEKINVQLATTLYKQARRQHDDKNVVVSPAAVLLGLGALSVGAKKNTKREIGITGQVPTVQGLAALARLLKKGGQQTPFQGIHGIQGLRGLQGLQGFDEQFDEEYTGQRTQIKPIVGIFLSQQTPAQQQFVQIVKGCLGVTVQKCDFQRHPQQCRQQINQFVSIKSQHKQPRLVTPQDHITDNTKMVVVSGLQLKAKWGRQFRQHQTTQGVFHPLDTQKIKRVPFMQKRGLFNYHEDETVKVLGIPTQGHELTLYVILPKHKEGLTQVEKEELVEGNVLKHLLDKAEHKQRQVNVRLPKFQIKHKLDAKHSLVKKGIVNMFDTKTADFSGITGRHPTDSLGQYGETVDVDKRAQIHVNKFLHQATIKITHHGITTNVGPQHSQPEIYESEQYNKQPYGQQYGPYGTEEEEIYGDYETTYTGRDRFDEIIGLNTYGQTKKQFNANRPFVFVVRHNPTKQVLLMGRVIDAGLKPTPTQQAQIEEIFPTQGIY